MSARARRCAESGALARRWRAWIASGIRRAGYYAWCALLLTLYGARVEAAQAKFDRERASLCARSAWLHAIAPADWIDATGIASAGFGRTVFKTQDGRRLLAYVYRASGFDPARSPIWFVMHGVSRDAQGYLSAAAAVAERHSVLVMAIEFSKHDYPDEEDYTLGVAARGRADEQALREGRWRKPHQYLYAELERVFEAVRLALKGEQRGYYLFGHSAGAQFTHRLLTFLPCARVLGAVAANAGWYTLPVAAAERRFRMPYGLRATPLEGGDLRAQFAAPLILLLGTRDTSTPDRDANLRATPEAMAQGATRLARGMHYFNTSKARAEAIGAAFRWRLAYAPRAAHQVGQVIASAGFLLFSAGEAPCNASSARDAGALRINELLADPPRGRAGDANGDGVRDASADEFVEIVNAGSTPLCLAGWSLGDASARGGHLFPLGAWLEPGQALVVFGGGVPAGRFGGAQVQTASSGGLSLSSAGDVLTLRDGAGTVVQQVSWGDCDKRACAKDHWDAQLGLGGSLVRAKEPFGAWRAHANVAGSEFSPGMRANGAHW